MEGPFRRSHPSAFRLIETLGWTPATGYTRLERHLARLRRTAAACAVPYDGTAIVRALAVIDYDRPMRVRLTVEADGRPEASAAPLAPDPAIWRLRIAGTRLDPGDPWLRVKTTERALYDADRADLPPGIDELIYLNTRGEVCEGTITNLFLERGDVLLTPPLACGLLPGVLRETLLASGAAREQVLRPRDLMEGSLHVGNSLRGLRPARLEDFIQA